MVQVSSSTKVNASVHDVWEVIGDPGTIADWHPGVAESRTDRGGAGAERRCTLADGGKLVERIEAHDDKTHTYTYTITEGALPVANYRATLSVKEADGGSVIEWRSEFEPTALDPERVENMMRQIYEAGLAELKKRFGG